MDFNFGNDNGLDKPEDENNTPFSFNPDNNSAGSDNSAANNDAPFNWTPNDMTNSDKSDPIAISDDIFSNDEKVDEETPQFVPGIPEETQDEVSNDDAEDVPDIFSDEIAVEQTDEAPAEDVPEEDVFEEQPEEASEEDVFEEQPEEASEEDVFEEPSEDASEEDAVEEQSEDVPEEDQTDEFIQTVSVPAALDKRVRTPDGEQEFLLSELIDVETGEPLDLTSLIPEELLTTSVAQDAIGGFSMGTAQSTTGGFDMSAGSESTTPSKRKRPARPKASQKKSGGILGIVMGGLLAVILFPYVMALIEITTGAQSNIPIPAPGIPSTYKYIPEWWPDWAMFVFPGRTTEATEKPADTPAQPNTNEPAQAENTAPADEEAPADDAAPTDEEAPADDASAVDDGAFDPDAFLGNDGAEANAQSEDVLADEPAADAPADEPAEPGVINAPVFTSLDVSESVAAVGKAFKAAKKIDDTVYAALSDMAEKSTFVDTSAVDDQLKDAMNKVRIAMGKFGTQETLASALSEKWAARAEDESDNAGVLFVGSLADVSERDGYQISTINVEGQDGAVEVVGLRKIKPAVGDKVVVCGKRIANPAQNLGGFTDNGKPVVWGGIVIKAEEK